MRHQPTEELPLRWQREHIGAREGQHPGEAHPDPNGCREGVQLAARVALPLEIVAGVHEEPQAARLALCGPCALRPLGGEPVVPPKPSHKRASWQCCVGAHEQERGSTQERMLRAQPHHERARRKLRGDLAVRKYGD